MVMYDAKPAFAAPRGVSPAELCMVTLQIWGEEALQFQEKLLNSSGLGDETYFPDSKIPHHSGIRICCTMAPLPPCAKDLAEVIIVWRVPLHALSIKVCKANNAVHPAQNGNPNGNRPSWDGGRQTRAISECVIPLAGIIQEPMRLTWNAALEETEMVLFESVHKLFKATGVSAQDVSHPHIPYCPSPSCSLQSLVRHIAGYAQ